MGKTAITRTVAQLRAEGLFRCRHCGKMQARKYVRLESHCDQSCCCADCHQKPHVQRYYWRLHAGI